MTSRETHKSNQNSPTVRLLAVMALSLVAQKAEAFTLTEWCQKSKDVLPMEAHEQNLIAAACKGDGGARDSGGDYMNIALDHPMVHVGDETNAFYVFRGQNDDQVTDRLNQMNYEQLSSNSLKKVLGKKEAHSEISLLSYAKPSEPIVVDANLGIKDTRRVFLFFTITNETEANLKIYHLGDSAYLIRRALTKGSKAMRGLNSVVGVFKNSLGKNQFLGSVELSIYNFGFPGKAEQFVNEAVEELMNDFRKDT